MSAIQFSTLYKLSQEGTRADYSLAAVSTAKQNVIKIVCNSPFTGDAVAAYRKYYIGAKSRFAKWKFTKVPDWYTEGLTNAAVLV